MQQCSIILRWARLVAPLALLMLLLAPLPALADAPDTRGPQVPGQGSVSTSQTKAAGVATGAVWRDVRALPLPALPARSATYVPRYQQAGGESGPIAWLGRELNPGNWILDAGMGIFAGIVKMFGGITQKAVEAFLGTASVLPSGCDNVATNFVFCTPASLTYEHPGVKTVWGILSGIGAGLVTVLFTVRLGRMIVEGPRTLATEGKGLLLTFIVAMTFIQATQPICRLIIDFFNGISTLLLSRAALALPSQDVGDLNLGSNILFLVLWAIILILIIKSFTRIVQIIILIACAPLAGALLMDRSTSSRFRSWFEKLIELLLAQINLVIIFVVITAILQPYAGRGAGDAFVSLLLSIVMMGMALSGKSVIGVAGAAMSGGGGGVLAFLRYQVVGGAIRSALGGRRRSDDRGEATSGAIGPQLRGAADGPQRAAQQSRERTTRASGDPAQSAAAQRQSTSGPAAGSSQPAGSFRLGDAGDSLASQRASTRYGAASQAPRGADGRLPLDARRVQARRRATMMQQRASTRRESGDRQGAETLERKARLHERFGRGQDIARPSRFTAADRATRRQTHRKTLTEVAGMHALEHDALSQQIAADAARLPIVQRDLALASSTGGDTAALHQEQEALTQRLGTNRARTQVIAPRADGSPARVTREAAGALANEQLAPGLRGHAYAARFGASNGSAFTRRIGGAATQGARDELARTRAHAARIAQLPLDRRPPVISSRPRSAAGIRKERQAPRPATAYQNASAQDEPARPARVRSSTIAMLRQHRQQVGRSGSDPIPSNTSRRREERKG